MVAPIRGANCRSASGGIAWSPSATRNQDGSDFQAGTPITSPRASAVQRLLHREHDLRRDRVNVGGEVVDEVVLGEPGEAMRSMSRCASAGVGGPCSSSAPIDSPSSSPNAAM